MYDDDMPRCQSWGRQEEIANMLETFMSRGALLSRTWRPFRIGRSQRWWGDGSG